MSQSEKFTLFWDGPFSQWTGCKLVIDDIVYNCAEQYMMAEKAKLFDDQDSLALIMESNNPREQKKIGRSVKNFHAERWAAVSREVVYNGNYAKFTQNPDLLNKLLATHGTTIVEASPYDCIWGIGLREEDERALDRSQWRGTNWLGEVLTGLREDLIEEGYK
jgi:ribA/ribD-fused uncharacterized protein